MKHLVIILFPALFLSLSCSKNQDPYDYENQRTSYFKNIHEQVFADSIIICVTYNIQLGFNIGQNPWQKDVTGATEEQIQNIADLLMQIDPDIIALQEVPRNRYNAAIKDFLERLANKMNMNYAFGSHGFNDPYDVYPVHGEWGTALLTKYKILEISNIQVEYIDKWQKRSLLNAKIQLNDSTTINTISLHFLPSLQGIPNTAEYLKTLHDPIILMGDFNYTGEISDFKGIGLEDVDSTYEIHWIDRIFYAKKYFKVLEIGTLTDTIGVSDHVPNYGKLQLK